MTMARRTIVRPGQPGVFHCVSRCVRQAFLCGFDRSTGRNLDHRKEWIRLRLKELASIFAVEVYSYAVMSNHCHVVLRVDPGRVGEWSGEEVVSRWLRLFPKERDRQGRPVPVTEAAFRVLVADEAGLATKRKRLGDLSWFMRCLNERIARRANAEDECKGRFWEGRFKCTRLEDEGAILSCMSYVDLNPVRAGQADRPEESRHTSIHERIKARGAGAKGKRAGWLAPIGEVRAGGAERPWRLGEEDYLRVVDRTGRLVREDKPGSIPRELAPILERLELEPANWVETVRGYGGLYQRIAGKVARLRQAAVESGQRWFRGRSSSLWVYRAA